MSTVTYKNQPAIHATRGAIPLVGTEHLYKVTVKTSEKVIVFDDVLCVQLGSDFVNIYQSDDDITLFLDCEYESLVIKPQKETE